MSQQEATGATDNAPVPETSQSESAAASQPSGAAGAVATAESPPDGGPVVLDDLGTQSFSDAVDATIVEFDDGDIVSGKVVKIDSDEVLLDIGYKSEGVIPSRELSIRNDIDPHEVVDLGEELEALVLQKEDKDGRLILSKKRAQYERAWGTIEAVKEKDGIVSGPVIEVVKGGLILDIGLRGFLPASLVDLRRVRDLHPFVGRNLDAKIIELDKNRNNVVLSRRAYLEETQREQRDEFLANLKPGEIRKGVVSSVVNFGAFVDLGGMDGLVHVSELSWKHVDHPSSVVQVGDEVEVQVLDVDLDRERISLSLKATQQDPWQEFANGHQVGELVYGKVTKLVPFGAFVQVGEGIEGLVHISEMAAHHVEAPEQVVTPGEELWVKIIDIDLDRRRISLSIKQAAEGGEVAAEYREHFGEDAFDEQGQYIGPTAEETEAAASAEAAAGGAAPAEGDTAADGRSARRGRSTSRGAGHGRHAAGRDCLSCSSSGSPAGSEPASPLSPSCSPRRGAVIVDADQVARAVVEPGQPALQKLVERFGEGILDADGRLARGALAKVAFADDESRLDLEAITHPAINEEFTRRVAEAPSDAVVVLDVPLLAESEQARKRPYQTVIVVEAPRDVRLARLEARGVDRADAEARMAAQADDEERRKLATYVVDNAGDRAMLERQIDDVWADLERRQRDEQSA